MQPDEDMIATLIQTYGESGKVEEAWQAYNSLGKGRAKDIQPTKRAFGSLVQAYVL
jgi:pentatricopeptide repeat protein